MGKHEYKGVRAQRAAALAEARREDKERYRRIKYGYRGDPSLPQFYPQPSARPTTPRPSSAAGLAMRSSEARAAGLVMPTAEPPKETVTRTSWKYLKTCFGLAAVILIGVGVLLGVTSHWATSNAGMAGIACICAGVGLVIGVVLFVCIKMKHDKLKEKRKEAKQAKTADVEAARPGTQQGGRKKTAGGGGGGGGGVEGEDAYSVQMRPMSSRPKRPKSSRPSTAGKKKRKKTEGEKENPVTDESPRGSLGDLSRRGSSDKDLIVPRSSSRTSMNLQGSINMSAIPEDGEEEASTSAAQDPTSASGASTSATPSTSAEPDPARRDSITSEIPGALQT